MPTGEPTPADSDLAVRKTVTVLFCDLVGSTAFAERVDAESARDAMGAYHTMASEVIGEAGGTVAKFIGDGVMALFGVPRTAEDDADRAVAAGIELQRRFAPIRDRIVGRHGAELGLRVGINTGEVVLAEDDPDIVGDALNTAARLEAACAPGEVLVGEETWRLTRAQVSYEVLGAVEVRGKDAPVAIYQVVGAGANDEQPTPFVGRRDELARLRAAFDDAVASKALRLVTIVGAPGVGKTRISRELSAALAEGADGTEAAVVAVLRCERAGASTFGPIADLLRTAIDVGDEATPDDVRAALRALVDNLDDADRVAELLAALVGAAPTRTTVEAFLGVRRLVEAFGRRQPLVVIVDDIQWAEPLFIDLLEYLAESVQDAAAMILCLARPELRELRPTLTEEGRRVAVAIALEGLDAEATAELAARLVGAESLPRELVARLPESTEGNPLFVRELMRMLVDDGVIERGDDGWQLTIDAEAVEVPPTIQSLLAARLDRLPEGERRLVELASVVGPEFPLGAVAAIAPAGHGAGELRRSLDGLRRRELVQTTTASWGDEPVYRFHHVLIRDAAYRRLLKRVRADLHLRVGEWTERTATEVPGEHEVAIAHHFEQAHEYRRQLDDVDAETEAVGRRAAALLRTAAERALARDDVAAAGALAERALDRLDRDDVAVPELLLVVCEALLALGEVTRARTRVDELLAAAEGDARLSAWADCFSAQVAVLTDPGRLQDADRQVAAAAERLAELGDEPGVAKARLVRAGALARLGRVGQCEAELDRALVAARSAGDRRRIAAVLGAAPLAALWGPSPIPRAGGRCLDVIRLLRMTTGSPAVEATSVRCQAVLEALRGRFDSARTMLADARATVEELGLRQGVAETELFAGIVELLAGDPCAAERPLRAAHHGLGRLGIGAEAGHAAAYLARALMQQGRLDEAEELAADSSALAGQNPQTAIAARSAQAEILAARGRYDEAVVIAAEAVELAAGTDIVVDRANANAVLARVARLAGDLGTADRAAAAAKAMYEQKAAIVEVDVGVEAPTPTSAGTRAEATERGSVDFEPADADADQPRPWNDADRWARDLFQAMAARRSDDLGARLAEDCELHEREPGLRAVHIGRDAVMAASSPGLFPEDATVVADVETIASRGHHLVLHRVAIHASDDSDGTTLDALHVSRWNEHGRVDFAAIYALEDQADAIAELDRLHRDGNGDVHEPRNEADRLARRFVELFTAGAREEWLPMISPSHVTRDKRPIVGVDTSGIAGVADAYPRDRDTREMSSTVETVAVRGQSFALIRWRATSSSGREWDGFHLTRWTADGLNDLNVIFPPDQLPGALAELDELWLAELEAPDVETYRTAHAWAEAYGSGDEARLRAVMHDDFVLTDHRVMGFGELDRERMLELMRSRIGTRGLAVPVTSAVHLLGGGTVVGTYHDRSSGNDGAEYVADTVFLCCVQDRQISAAEFFDAGCVDAARQAAVALVDSPEASAS